MPCAPPKEEEVRVGYLRWLLQATHILYVKWELEFKKKIKKILFCGKGVRIRLCRAYLNTSYKNTDLT
jgi:hypothetical protein